VGDGAGGCDANGGDVLRPTIPISLEGGDLTAGNLNLKGFSKLENGGNLARLAGVDAVELLEDEPPTTSSSS